MSDEGRKTILAIGEVLWDLLPDGPRLGGAPFNFAYRINSLGDAGLMVSRLGQDDLGDDALERVRALGVNSTWLQRDAARPTGTVQVRFDEKGIPDYFIVPNVAYDYIEITSVLEEAAAQADCLCFGTLVQRTDVTRGTLRHLLDCVDGCLRVLDINLRRDCYSRETVEYSLGHAKLLKLNDDEVRTLNELLSIRADSPVAFCAEIMSRYPLELCLVTFGADGALAISRTGETVYEPGYRVDVVDTLGSGDAFTAGFVHRYLRGATVPQACRFGNALGALVATLAGGTEPVAPETVAQLECDSAERSVLPELEGYIVD